jgi:hypothetical protein
VEIYNKIGIENIIIYCELDDRDLFQADRSFGKDLTLINTKHAFYTKVIEPLKDRGQDDVLASIELLISSLSRSGHNNFKDEELEVIKEFYNSASKDLKRILNKTVGLSNKLDENIDDSITN